MIPSYNESAVKLYTREIYSANKMFSNMDNVLDAWYNLSEGTFQRWAEGIQGLLRDYGYPEIRESDPFMIVKKYLLNTNGTFLNSRDAYSKLLDDRKEFLMQTYKGHGYETIFHDDFLWKHLRGWFVDLFHDDGMLGYDAGGIYNYSKSWMDSNPLSSLNHHLWSAVRNTLRSKSKLT